MTTFFTADTHFGHGNIIYLCNRPQLRVGDVNLVDGRTTWVSPEIKKQRTQEMDATMTHNWNDIVTKDDDVYHLGDVCFGSMIDAVNYLSSLNFRRLYLIWGNHDGAMEDLYRAMKAGKAPLSNRIVFLGDMKEVKVEGQLITLCHYAMRVWNKSHHDAWHLYGHSHGSLPDDPHARSLDVGVDVHNFCPISLDELKIYMSKKDFIPVDHHVGQQVREQTRKLYA